MAHKRRQNLRENERTSRPLQSRYVKRHTQAPRQKSTYTYRRATIADEVPIKSAIEIVSGLGRSAVSALECSAEDKYLATTISIPPNLTSNQCASCSGAKFKSAQARPPPPKNTFSQIEYTPYKSYKFLHRRHKRLPRSCKMGQQSNSPTTKTKHILLRIHKRSSPKEFATYQKAQLQPKRSHRVSTRD